MERENEKFTLCTLVHHFEDNFFFTSNHSFEDGGNIKPITILKGYEVILKKE